MTSSSSVLDLPMPGTLAASPTGEIFTDTNDALLEQGWRSKKNSFDSWYAANHWKDAISSQDLDVDGALAAIAPRRTNSALLTGVPAESGQLDLLAEWDGYVTHIGEHFFGASLKGVFGQGVEGELEEAEIPILDVNKSDSDLFQLGSVFRLCVFYEELPNGQPRRFTQVVFRRLPAYRLKNIRSAEEAADEIHKGLRVE